MSHRHFEQNRQNLRLKTKPATPVCTLAEAKSHLRIDTSDDDALITAMIEAATLKLEAITDRAFITQTWTLWMDFLPIVGHGHRGHVHWDGERLGAFNDHFHVREFIELNKSPLQSITHLKTYDDEDTDTVFPATNYFADKEQEPGRLTLRSGSVWPTGTFRRSSSVEVEFIAGYGAAADVPQNLKQAVIMLVAHLYEHRGDNVLKTDQIQDAMVPSTVWCLLQPFCMRFL